MVSNNVGMDETMPIQYATSRRARPSINVIIVQPIRAMGILNHKQRQEFSSRCL